MANLKKELAKKDDCIHVMSNEIKAQAERLHMERKEIQEMRGHNNSLVTHSDQQMRWSPDQTSGVGMVADQERMRELERMLADKRCEMLELKRDFVSYREECTSHICDLELKHSTQINNIDTLKSQLEAERSRNRLLECELMRQRSQDEIN